MIIREGIELVRFHEGLKEVLPDGRIKSYLCPAGVWTIGRGSTRMKGKAVRAGLICTLEEVELQFVADINEAEAYVRKLVKPELNPYQLAALTSFVQNIGVTQFADSTVLRLINGGADVYSASKQELPRWNNDGLAGLVARRQKELDLMAKGEPPSPPETSVTNDLINFDSAAANDERLDWQIKAWKYLNTAVSAEVKQKFAAIYRRGPAKTPAPTNDASRVIAGFPFFPQNDNGPEGWRQCQTSTIAMLLKHKGIAGIKDDLDYLKIVNRFGDTTLQETHYKALDSLNVDYEFHQDFGVEEVKQEIRKGNGVGLGVVHHGPVTAPVGGGHWVAAYGYTPTSWKIMDPYGELNLVGGGWSRQGGSTGKAVDYSFRNFNRRWEVVLKGGVYVYTPGHGWAWVIR